MSFNDDTVLNYCSCPRCGERGLENFNSHSYCVNCNYSEAFLTNEERLLKSLRITSSVFEDSESDDVTGGHDNESLLVAS